MDEVGPKPGEQPKPDEAPLAEAGPGLAAVSDAAPEPSSQTEATPKADISVKTISTPMPAPEPRRYNRPGPDRGLTGDLGLRSEYEPKPDYGHKRRFAAYRSYLIAAAAVLIGAIAAVWLFGRFLALASLPAILILASLLLAAILRACKPPWMRALALTPLAFAIGLLPHALFLTVYNLTAPLGGQGDPGYLPALGGLAGAYETAVLKLHAKTEALFEGPGLILYSLVSIAVIAAAAWWSVRAGRLALRVRAGVGLVQVVLLGALATTVFSQVPSGRWIPDRYADRLQADLTRLDQTRTQMLLAQSMAEAINENAPAIRQALAPTIRAAAETVAQRQPSVPDAVARQLGKTYASAVAKAGLADSGLGRIDPGPAGALPKASADPHTVKAVERELGVEQQKLDIARRGLATVMADAIGGVSTGSPAADAFIGPFVTGYLDEMFDRVSARFNFVWGPDLTSRLGRIDATPGHPLTSGIGRLLAGEPAPIDAARFAPASLGQYLPSRQRDSSSAGQQVLELRKGAAADTGKDTSEK